MTQEAPINKSLAEVLAIFKRAVPSRESFEFELTPLDRLNIPLWGAFVWADDGDFSDGFGYGADTLSARVSAWGEILENYWASQSLKTMPRRRASFEQITAANLNAVDPISLCLDAGVDYSPDKELMWTTGKNYATNADIWLPIESAAISPSDIKQDVKFEDLLFLPITNGLGAGASLEQAIAHGVLELIQRDGDSVTFRAMDEGTRIELDDVRDVETRELLRYLDESNIEVIPKLAGVVCGIPVIYVVGYDRDLAQSPFHLSLSACGEAAHPDRERALSKALREFVSSRARKRFMHGSIEDMQRVAPAKYCERVLADEVWGDESRALTSVLEWIKLTPQQFFDTIKSPIFEVKQTVKFSTLPTVAQSEIDSAEKLLTLLAKRLQAAGMPILYHNFTPSDAKDFAVVKAVVPGLEVETMSYNRIGRRNFERLLERGNRESKFANLVGVGDKPNEAVKIHLTKSDEQQIGGAAWLNPREVENAVGKLYALYREPNGHTVGKVHRV